MKKIINTFILSAAFFASCEKAADIRPVGADENHVVVSMNIPQTDLSPVVRSTEGEESVLRYVAEIWKYDGISAEYSQFVYRMEEKADDTKSAYMKFPLEEQGKYRLLLWADYIDASAEAGDGKFPDKYYDTSVSLKAVTSKSASLNDATSDAFFKVVDFEKGDVPVFLEGLVLSRAVAKLTVKEKVAASWQKAVSFSVSYKVPAVFDVETGTASGEEIVEVADCKLAGDAESYDYTIFFDNVLVSGAQEYNVASVALSGKDADGNVYEKAGIENVTLRQNTKTVLSGSDMLVDPSGKPEEPEVTYEFTGKGTPEEPFLISTGEELLRLMELVNKGVLLPSDPSQRKYADACYLQTENINLTNNNVDIMEKVCIGTSDNPFTGTYDGGAKVLTGTDGVDEKGFTVSASTEDMPYVALFGVVDGAELKNIRAVANNQNKASATVSAAGICAVSKGETLIENSECLVQNITCSGPYVGGICGMVESGKLTVRGCKVAQKANSGVKGNDSSNEYIGGVLGFVKDGATAEISDSYNTAKIVQTPDEADCMGGICGGNAGTLVVDRCYNTGVFTYGKNVADATQAKALSGTIVGGGDSLSGVNTNECWFVPGAKKTKARFEQGTKFGEKKWPAWDVNATVWASLGVYSADAPEYPVLDWE